tara:strand:+ start:332 stop:829 length:498 start_codon:yes stop_codon:yes gene_type:complete
MEDAIYQKLMDYALRLLGRRSYTVHDISKKLLTRATKLKNDEPEATIEAVIQRLIELKYLDDLRFCKYWVEERSRLRPRGRFLLTQELRRKGIPKELLEEFWEKGFESSFDEVPLALQLIEKRLPRLKKSKNEWETKQKLYGFLASRGFSVGAIKEALDKALKPY